MSLLKAAWALVSRRRSLWWLGLIAGLGQGYGISSQFSYRLDQSSSFTRLQQLLAASSTSIAPILLLALFLVLAIWLAAVVSEAGLTLSVRDGSRNLALSFREAFRSGRSFLWPLVQMNLVLAVFSLVLALTIALPAARMTGSSGFALLTGWVGLSLFFLYSVLLALLYPWISRFIILDKRGGTGALLAAWQLFRTKMGRLITLGVVGVLAQILVMVSLGVLALIVLFLALGLLYVTVKGSIIASFATLLVLLIFIGALLFVLGAVTAWKNAYYTLAYLQFVEHP